MARATTGVAYLVLGLVLLGSLVFTVFVTLPAWSAWRSARDQLAAKIVEREQRREFLADIDSRSAELKTYERDARALGVAFPETKAPADLAAVVHALSTRNGVVVESMGEPKLRKASTSPPSERLPATARGDEGGEQAPSGIPPREAVAPSRAYEFLLTARGTYAQLRSFLLDLERSLRLFDLTAVELTAGRLEEGGTVKAQVTLTTYLVEL